MRNILSQSAAARLRGVSRQRISQLVKAGRLATAQDEQGNVLGGLVYAEDVLNLETGKRGRPRLTEEQLAQRNVYGFAAGEIVCWTHTPRDGYGFSVFIPVTIDKLGGKRIRVTFSASDNEKSKEVAVWVDPGQLRSLASLDESDATEVIQQASMRAMSKHPGELAANENGAHPQS